jgi:hypothetical protein
MAYTPVDYRDAIARIESGGNYGAVGPRTKSGDRAFGRYQMMGNNIPAWSKQVLGRSVSIDEFMKDPKLQDQIFDGIFGGYVNKYGLENAAQAWFGGPGSIGKGGRKDQLGTSVNSYGKQFMANLGVDTPETNKDGTQVADAGAGDTGDATTPEPIAKALLFGKKDGSGETKGGLFAALSQLGQDTPPAPQITHPRGPAEGPQLADVVGQYQQMQMKKNPFTMGQADPSMGGIDPALIAMLQKKQQSPFGGGFGGMGGFA